MKSISRRAFLRFVGLTAGAGLLSACSSTPPSQSSGGAGAKPAATSAAGAGAAPAPTAVAKPASAANSLTFIWGAANDKLDPPAMNGQEDFIASIQIHECLVRDKPGSTEIMPGLAEKWEISADGLSYIFHLRPNVKFHDGSPLTAEVVAFNFDRSLNTENPLYKEAQSTGGFPFMGDYVGNVVTKVEATGPLDVKFTLKRKFSPLLSNLAIPPTAIVSMEALKKYGNKINDNPVGTGPFKLVEWKRGDHITLETFDGYWGTKPKLQRIVFQTVPEASVRALKIQRGEADVAWPIDPKDVPSLKGKADTDVLEAAGLNVDMAEFNLKKPQFQNKQLRQALNYAINRQELCDKLYSGAAIPEAGVLPPGSFAYDKTITGYTYDPQKAKSLLAAAGYKGETIQLDTYSVPRPYNPQGSKLAEAIQQYFQDVGVKSDIKTYEWTEYRKIRRAAQLNLAFGGWVADTGDPDNFLGVFFNSESAGGINTSFYSVPEVDKLLNQADEETDIEKRKALFSQAEKRIVEDAPWLFIAHIKQQVAIRKRVKGFVLQPTYVYYLDNVSVE